MGEVPKARWVITNRRTSPWAEHTIRISSARLSFIAKGADFTAR